MSKIRKNQIVKKRNALNEMRPKGMTLQEVRFLSIYLSKIDKDDETTRLVRFSLDDFQAVMDITRLDIAHTKRVTDALMGRVVSAPIENENGKMIGYDSFHLFKRCRVILDDPSGGHVEIDAADEALPLMFNYKEKYFSYKLSNALSAKSMNQLRMYEILKQYQKIGKRILSVEELRRQLGIDEKEYQRFGDFKRRVLDACQTALAEHTDIKYTYAPYGKRGQGGKILSIQFIIEENNVKQMDLTEFIQQNKKADDDELSEYDRKMLFLADACDNEFAIAEIFVMHDLMIKHLPPDTIRNDLECYNFLLRKYRYMNMQNENHKIANRCAYMRSIIEKGN